VQFRLLEALLGLRREQRVALARLPLDRLPQEQREALARAEAEPSLFELVEKWLERTPFLELPGYQFWASYRAAVDAMLAGDRRSIEKNPTLSEPERAVQLRELDATAQGFAALLDEAAHRKLVGEGRRRLSQRATLAALLIHLYRDRPILHLPFRLLTLLVDLDERLSVWRYRHAAMAQRMIGSKIGTGGSAGHHYLMGTVERNRIFTDLVELSTYLIPRSALPELPPELERRLGFYFPRE
jgi:tryptophan 2,3-dioxygenase